MIIDRNRALFALIIVSLSVVALTARLKDLERRPMHADEANQAVKFGLLLEEGEYRYDPHDHHGPTLYYFTLPIAWLSGAESIKDLNEGDIRLLPVIFGSALILLYLGMGKAIGKPAAAVGALMAVISPGLFFFSRYYIQEILLVFFTFAALISGWWFTRRPTPWRAVLLGLSLGLMFATKETTLIAWLAMACALAVVAGRRIPRFIREHQWLLLHVVATAALVYLLLFSSFFTYPRGLWDALATFFHHASRAGGAGHEKPWHYYLGILIWHKAEGTTWSEMAIVLPALYAGLRSISSRSHPHVTFIRFMGIFSLLVLIVYSLVPYKTPWLIITFLQSCTVLAGAGIAMLIRDVRYYVFKFAVVALLAAALLQLSQQTRRGSFLYDADERNPYVYVHTSRDLLRAVRRIHQCARLHESGYDMVIKVMAPEYWPLPWYLRHFSNVGYWHSVPANPEAAIMITDPRYSTLLTERLGGEYEYVTDFAGLRPGVILYVYYRRDLWETVIQQPPSSGAYHEP